MPRWFPNAPTLTLPRTRGRDPTSKVAHTLLFPPPVYGGGQGGGLLLLLPLTNQLGSLTFYDHPTNR